MGSLGRQVADEGPNERFAPGPGLPIPIRWHHPAVPLLICSGPRCPPIAVRAPARIPAQVQPRWPA